MISMFSLVAWECVLAAPVSERRGALSLIFILLKLRIVESFTRRYESYLCLHSEGNQRTRQQCGACGVAVGESYPIGRNPRCRRVSLATSCSSIVLSPPRQFPRDGA